MSIGVRGGAEQYIVISGGAGNPSVIAGTVDPTAGGGVPAVEGSNYMRYVGAAGELWIKTGAAATAWSKAATGAGVAVWTDDGTRLQPVNNGRRIRMDNGGGNRGALAADFQQTRSIGSEVASGARSFIAAGQNNRASGADTFCSGEQCQAAAGHSSAQGKQSQARWLGSKALAGGQFNEQGDAQSMEMVVRATSNDTNLHVLTLDGIEPATALNSLDLANIRYAWIIEVRLIGGHELQGGLSQLGGWILRCVIGRRSTGNTVDIQGPVEIDELVNQRGDVVDLVGNSVLGSIEVQVTPGDETLRKWVAHVRATQFRWFAF
jgi:hypothetical protein